MKNSTNKHHTDFAKRIAILNRLDISQFDREAWRLLIEMVETTLGFVKEKNETIKKLKGVFADQLQKIFSKYTGLHTRL